MWIRMNEKELQALFDGLSRFKEAGLISGFEGELDSHPLVEAVRRAVREEWAALLKRDPAPVSGHASGMREAVKRFADRTVELSTPGGAVQGKITEVGRNYAVITEQGGIQVMVALMHIIGLEPVQGA